MFEAVLAGPLCHAAGEIDFTSADLPAFVAQLDDHAHGSRADDAPFTIADVSNFHNFAINQSRDRTDSDRVPDAIDVAAQRRLPVVDVFGRAEHFEIQTRPPLAPNVDC